MCVVINDGTHKYHRHYSPTELVASSEVVSVLSRGDFRQVSLQGQYFVLHPIEAPYVSIKSVIILGQIQNTCIGEPLTQLLYSYGR